VGRCLGGGLRAERCAGHRESEESYVQPLRPEAGSGIARGMVLIDRLYRARAGLPSQLAEIGSAQGGRQAPAARFGRGRTRTRRESSLPKQLGDPVRPAALPGAGLDRELL